MLVCSVVLRTKRATLGAAVLEIADARDSPSLGAVFAILADDNASAGDTVSGFVGQLMTEAALATDVVNAGSIRNAAIVEETNAGASPSAYAPGIVVATMIEAASAASAQDWESAAPTSAVLEGTFVDPSGTLLGTDVLDSGPVTVFEP